MRLFKVAKAGFITQNLIPKKTYYSELIEIEMTIIKLYSKAIKFYLNCYYILQILHIYTPVTILNF